MRHITKILLVLFLIFAVMAFSKIYSGLKITARKNSNEKITFACSMSLRIICNRFYRYAVSSKLESPTTMQWCDNMIADSEKDILSCVGRENQDIKYSYAINKNVDKYKFDDLPDDLVLFFESNLGWNGVGDKNDVNYSNHDGGLAGVVTASGEIGHAEKEIVENLRWE